MSRVRKIVFRSLVTLLILLIATVATIVIYYQLHLHYDEDVSMRLTEDVIMINDILGTSYLIKTKNDYIAIDGGLTESLLEKAMEINGIDSRTVKAVFITHSDPDHINGINVFKNADIYFPEEEKKMIEENQQRFGFLPFYSNSMVDKNVILLNDSDIVFIDSIKVECVALPGHTLGSMGYIVDEIYLFTGDAFRIKNGKLSVPNKKFLAMDITKMKLSLKKIAKRNKIKYIFSAHSDFTADFDFAISEWR